MLLYFIIIACYTLLILHIYSTNRYSIQTAVPYLYDFFLLRTSTSNNYFIRTTELNK